jgi:thiol-disulfide isomerase/thioredoxin/outer membrane lipoprotein-sorting protein
MKVARFVVPLVAVGLGLATPVRADPPTGAEVLGKAQAAVKTVNAVTYTGESRAEGALAAAVPSQTGKVTLARSPTPVPKIRMEASPLPADEKQPPILLVTSDGTTFCMIDHQKKQFARREGPEAAMAMLPPTILLMVEFVSDKAFVPELAGESQTYVGTEKVGEVECHVVEVKYGSGRGEARWYLGTKDFLPRRLERSFAMPAGPARGTFTIKSLEINPTLKDDIFRLEPPEGYSAPPSPSATGLLPVGTEAPDWTLETPDGKAVSLKDLRGKVVVLDFWATWCVPCKKAMPDVQKLSVRFKDKPIAVFGVAYRETGNPAKYMKEKGFTYGLLLKGEKLEKPYGIKAIPTFYVIGHDGKVFYADTGSDSADALVDAVERALKAIK